MIKDYLFPTGSNGGKKSIAQGIRMRQRSKIEMVKKFRIRLTCPLRELNRIFRATRNGMTPVRVYDMSIVVLVLKFLIGTLRIKKARMKIDSNCNILTDKFRNTQRTAYSDEHFRIVGI